MRSMELVSQKWKEELTDEAEESWPRAKSGWEYISLVWVSFSLFDSSLTQLSHFSFSFILLLGLFSFYRSLLLEKWLLRDLWLQIFAVMSFFLSFRSLVKRPPSSESPFLTTLPKRPLLSFSDSFYSFFVFFLSNHQCLKTYCLLVYSPKDLSVLFTQHLQCLE